MQIKTDSREQMCQALEAMQKDQSTEIVIAKDHATEIKAATPEGVVPVVTSTEDKDRDGDVIRSNGWDLKDYKKNPVILWAHDYSQLPIGQAHNTRKGEGMLISEMEFTPHDLNPLGDTVGRMIKGGFLRTVSVGFKPAKFKALDGDDGLMGGIEFLKQSLLEYSVVPVPSNPNALIGAKEAGIDMTSIKEWTEKVLDGESAAGLWMPRDYIEEMRKAINTSRVFGLHHVEPRTDDDGTTDDKRAALAELTREGQEIQNAIDAQHVNGEQRSIPGEVGGIVGDLDPEVYDPAPANLYDVTATTTARNASEAITGDDSHAEDAAREVRAQAIKDLEAEIARLKAESGDEESTATDADASTESDDAAPVDDDATGPGRAQAGEEKLANLFDDLDAFEAAVRRATELLKLESDPMHNAAKQIRAALSGEETMDNAATPQKGEG
jgi:HK97 family phage prohead protease